MQSKLKYVKFDIYFVRDFMLNNKLQHFPVAAQIADILKKLLSSTSFVNLRYKLNVHEPTTIGLRVGIFQL